MTATLEAPVTNLTSVTIRGSEVAGVVGALRACLPHAGKDEMLPALMHLRVTFKDQRVEFAATDRFTMALTSAPADVSGEATFLLGGKDAKALLTFLGKERNGTLLAFGDGFLTAGWRGEQRFLVGPSDYSFPNIETLLATLREKAEKQHEPLPPCFSPDNLAKFGPTAWGTRFRGALTFKPTSSKANGWLVGIANTSIDFEYEAVIMAQRVSS